MKKDQELLNEASQILDRADHVDINGVLNTVHCPAEGMESLRMSHAVSSILS